MTQDEIIRMAREADVKANTTETYKINQETYDWLERFAALVAAHEREACAKVCEEFGRTVNVETWDMAGKDCAVAIRARATSV